MDGSRTIRVLKRDGVAEDFSAHKLAAAMWRAMIRAGAGRYGDAADLALAIQIYLQRSGWQCVSSAAVFEMTVKILRRVRMLAAADAMEAYRDDRCRRRRRLRVSHDGRQITCWDKSWLARLGGRSWTLSPMAARIIAGQVERDLLRAGRRTVERGRAMELFSARVAEYGLADAVPVAG